MATQKQKATVAKDRIKDAIGFSIEKEGLSPQEALDAAREMVNEYRQTCEWEDCERPVIDDSKAWATYGNYCKPHDRKSTTRP